MTTPTSGHGLDPEEEDLLKETTILENLTALQQNKDMIVTFKSNENVRGLAMAGQNLNYYIAQLELLRDIERKDLIRSEVVLKYQDKIVAEMLSMSPSKVISRNDIFISYSHKDKKWLEKLSAVFAPLVRQERMLFWSDAQIQPEDEWKQEIQIALERAKIAVLLVSPDFLASDFIAKYELPPLLKAAEQGGLTILWIAVRACLYTRTDIAKYQAVNNPSKPLARVKPEQVDDELVRICEHIERVMQQ